MGIPGFNTSYIGPSEYEQDYMNMGGQQLANMLGVPLNTIEAPQGRVNTGVDPANAANQGAARDNSVVGPVLNFEVGDNVQTTPATITEPAKAVAAGPALTTAELGAVAPEDAEAAAMAADLGISLSEARRRIAAGETAPPVEGVEPTDSASAVLKNIGYWAEKWGIPYTEAAERLDVESKGGVWDTIKGAVSGAVSGAKDALIGVEEKWHATEPEVTPAGLPYSYNEPTPWWLTQDSDAARNYVAANYGVGNDALRSQVLNDPNLAPQQRANALANIAGQPQTAAVLGAGAVKPVEFVMPSYPTLREYGDTIAGYVAAGDVGALLGMPPLTPLVSPDLYWDPVTDQYSAATEDGVVKVLDDGTNKAMFLYNSLSLIRATARNSAEFMITEGITGEVRKGIDAALAGFNETLENLQHLNSKDLLTHKQSLDKSLLELTDKLKLLYAEAIETQQTITLPSQALTNQTYLNSLIELGKGARATLLMDAGPEKMNAMRTYVAATPPMLPSEVRWDSAKGDFLNATGFEGRQRDADTIRYLNIIKPLYEQRDNMRVLTDAYEATEDTLRRSQQEQANQDARFNAALKDDDFEIAEEAAYKRNMAEAALAKAQAQQPYVEMFSNLMANPVALAFAYRTGLIDILKTGAGGLLDAVATREYPERQFGGADGQATGVGTGMPGFEEYRSMDTTQRTLVMVDYIIATGKSPEDFANEFMSQLPGQARAATRYGSI